jgi:RHS repeat-associated protein
MLMLLSGFWHRKKPMPTQSRKTILLATDQQRSVLNALDANLAHASAYTPYGHRPLSGLLSLLGFNGELMDLLTGNYHLGNGYRPFSPVLMRFFCPDSWSPFGKGGLNAYAYCMGNPVNWKDPTGHSIVPASVFDDIFMNSYKLMNTSNSERFSNIVTSTNQLFGGTEKLQILAKTKNIHPDALTARALPYETKLSHFKIETPLDQPAGIDYLFKADKHIRDTLDKVTINTGLLNPGNTYLEHFDETEIRNLRANLLTHKNELAEVVSHVSSLRIEGVSPAAGHFNAQDFIDTANRIRDSR